MKVFGFTLLRNGIKYDYPFRESLRSLCALCDTVYIALGNSDDATEQALQEFKNVKIVPTVWDEGLRKSGLILSQQTNIALDALKAEHAGGWGIYLQADEVLSERDFALIRKDLQRAEAQGCDAVSFRYLHFWLSHHKIAVDKRWYPQEIRAIRLDSPARSYGDAQSFQGWRKRLESDAFVYHYGHVREAGAYAEKKKDFNRWWHSDEEMGKILAKGKRRDRHEKTVDYLGPHPSFMKNRIGEEKKSPSRLLVYGRPGDVPDGVDLQTDLRFTESVTDLWKNGPEHSLVLAPLPLWARFLSFLGFGPKAPPRMGSPQAREWDSRFRFILELSARGVGVR
jgi:hypothetical protein